jgi:GDPmannose 4,6-dehydratase
MKKALIIGITGQDGSYLAELLLANNYEVHGVKRRSSILNTSRIDHLFKDPHYGDVALKLHYGDITDTTNLYRLIHEIQPDEIYNLAGMSQVQISFAMPEYVFDSIATGVVRLMEAVRLVGEKNMRVYQASSSEMFGGITHEKLDESSQFFPQSPYANSKLHAYHSVKYYRECYKIWASNGILFNHESPRRGENFVTRKITLGAAKFIKNNNEPIFLGNLDSFRDWGHAKDYVSAMHKILLHSEPSDFVVATGISTSVREFCVKVFNTIGLQLVFQNEGIDETAKIASISTEIFRQFSSLEPPKIGTTAIKISQDYFRPAEVQYLLGNAEKIRKSTGWTPTVSLDELILEMVLSDFKVSC